MTKSNIKCLSPNELESVEIKIKIPKELNDFVERFAMFLRIPGEELLNDIIRQGIQGIVGTFDGYGLEDIVKRARANAREYTCPVCDASLRVFIKVDCIEVMH